MDANPEFVSEGIFRIPLPLPDPGLKSVNVYAILGSEGVVLIDAGWALTAAERRLEEGLLQCGAALADVTSFLVTHVHRDHYTQAVTVRRRTGASIALGLEERESLGVLMDPGSSNVAAQIEGLRRAGATSLASQFEQQWPGDVAPASEWEWPDEWLRDGDILRLPNGGVLDTLATPGHTAGHVCFRDQSAGLLFAGDHILPGITPSIGYVPSPGASPLLDYLASLARVRALPDTVLLPAHGRVVSSTHRRIDELLEHHSDRFHSVLGSVARGATTALEIAHSLKWTRKGKALKELDPFNQALAILETAFHAEVLVAQARLTADHQDDVRCFRLAAGLGGLFNSEGDTKLDVFPESMPR